MTIITDSRIKWKCRRGLLELDVILEKFCETVLPTMSEEDKKSFFFFLDTPDQILLDWVYANVMPGDERAKKYVLMLREID